MKGEKSVQDSRIGAEPFVHCVFFLRLPNGQYGPVSQLSYPEEAKEAVQVHLIGAEPIVQVKE